MSTIACHRPPVRRLALLGVLLALAPLQADDWPQWRGPQRDGVWGETGVLRQFPQGGLKVRWRAPVGTGSSSPVVARGRVFVLDCVLGPKEKLQARERIHCFDESSGKRLWTQAYDAEYPDFAWPPNDDFGGPIATPVVHEGRVYAAGAVGDLVCLDAQGGTIHWRNNLAKGYGIGGDFCRTGSPLIEGDLLIVQTACNQPRAGILAFDPNSGAEVWRALEDHGYYSSPLVVTAGGKRQLIAVTERWVTSLDPATGKTYWREKFALFRNIPTPVVAEDRLLVNGLMLRLDPDRPAAKVLWPERMADAFLSDTTTGIFVGDLVLSHKRPDRLACLDAATGTLLWEADQVKSTTHSLTLCGDGVFVFTDQGELLRAEVRRAGFKEISRAALIKPTTSAGKNKWVVYAAPAYANGHVFARNDQELVCARLTANRPRE